LHPVRRPHATPSARRALERSLRTWGATIFRYRLRFLTDLAVAALVLSLPLSLRAAPSIAVASAPPMAAPEADVLAAFSSVDAPRAQTVARGETITATGGPSTAIAPDVKPIERYLLGPSDTLQTIANHYGVSAEAIAFSNGITDPDLRSQAGREIMIPPGAGSLYTVKDDDTVESVASRFGVDPKAIMEYNRLYFEPEHFGPEQLIFVPGATVPGLVYAVARPSDKIRPPAALPMALPAAAAAVAAPSGRFAWPVGGRITQYFWAFHTGVDLAAAYGTGVGASQDGTVVFTGWVAVGGLSVRIKHADGFETGYYHLGAVFVAPGQQVSKGQIVASIGMTGVTTGPHVHWELKQNGAFVNPLAYTSR